MPNDNSTLEYLQGAFGKKNEIFNPDSIFRALDQKMGTAPSVDLSLPDLALDMGAPAQAKGAAADTNFFTSPTAGKIDPNLKGGPDTAGIRALDALDRREARDAKKQGTLLRKDALNAVDASLGLDTTQAAAVTDAALGAKPAPRIRLEQKWNEVQASPEWQQLPWEEQAKARKEWMDARVNEATARVTAATGKAPKATEIAELRKRLDDGTKASVVKTERSWLDSDIVDTAVFNTKSWWSGRQIRDANGDPAKLEEALAMQAANKATYESQLSDFTKNEQKKINLMSQDMMRKNQAETGSTDLTMGQEAQLGLATFKSDPYKAILGNLPTTIAAMGASLAGGAVGTLGGPVGTAVGAAAGGSLAGQELTSAEIASSIADEVGNLKPEDLAKSPQYAQLLQFHGGDANKAKTAFIGQLVEDSETQARLWAGAAGSLDAFIGAGKAARQAIGQAAGSQALGGITARTLAKYGLGGVSKNSAIKQAAEKLAPEVAEKGIVRAGLGLLKAPLQEAGQEFVEEGGGAVVGNLAQRRGGLETGTFTGAVEQGVMGALSGAGTTVGIKAAGAVANKAFGPMEDQGDVVVTRDKNGALTSARNAKTAADSNIVMDRETGFMRLRDAENEADPSAADTMYRLNTQLVSALASQEGVPMEAGLMAGHGLNAILLGQGANGLGVQIPVGNTLVNVVAGADGKVSLATPAQVTPETQAAVDAANRVVEQLAPAVSRFAQRTVNYEAPVVNTQQTAPGVVNTQQTGGTNAAQTQQNQTSVPGQPAGTGQGLQGNGQAGNQQTQVGGSGAQTGAGDSVLNPGAGGQGQAQGQGQTQVTPPTGFAVGDQVSYNGQAGQVVAVSRYDGRVMIETPAGDEIRVPASDMQNVQRTAPVVNTQQTGAGAAAPVVNTQQTGVAAPVVNTQQTGAPGADREAEIRTQADAAIAAVRADANRSPFQVMRDTNNAVLALLRIPALADQYVNRPEELPENLKWARMTLGLQVTVGQSAIGTGWAQAVREANNPLQAVVDSSRAGDTNVIAAEAVLTMYGDANIPLPAVEYSPNPTRNERGAYSYGGGTHRIRFNSTTTAATVPHEYLHGLTAKGLLRMSQGSTEQRQTMALLTHLRSLLPNQAYMADSNAETLAELFRPEAIAFMTQTQYDLSTFPPDARAAAERLLSRPSSSLADLFFATIEDILNRMLALSPKPGSIAELLTRVAAEATEQTRESIQGRPPRTDAAPAAPAATETQARRALNTLASNSNATVQDVLGMQRGDTVTFSYPIGGTSGIPAGVPATLTTIAARSVGFQTPNGREVPITTTALQSAFLRNPSIEWTVVPSPPATQPAPTPPGTAVSVDEIQRRFEAGETLANILGVQVGSQLEQNSGTRYNVDAIEDNGARIQLTGTRRDGTPGSQGVWITAPDLFNRLGGSQTLTRTDGAPAAAQGAQDDALLLQLGVAPAAPAASNALTAENLRNRLPVGAYVTVTAPTGVMMEGVRYVVRQANPNGLQLESTQIPGRFRNVTFNEIIASGVMPTIEAPGSVSSLRQAATPAGAAIEPHTDPAGPYSGGFQGIADFVAEMPTAQRFRNLVSQLAARVSTIGTRMARYIDPGQLPANVLAANASIAARYDAVQNFISAYASAANGNLREQLARATTLEEKRAVGERMFGIRMVNRNGALLRPGSENMYFSGLVSSNNSFGVEMTDINNPNNKRTYVGGIDYGYGMADRLHFNTTSFREGSGEGNIFYDALYGAAVHAGLKIKVNILLGPNRRRMPLNRLKAILKWGDHFSDIGAAETSLVGLSKGREGLEAPTNRIAGGSARFTLPTLFQYVEQQAMSGINTAARPLGYDFATNQVLAGASRTPITNLKDWVGTQLRSTPSDNGFTMMPSVDAIRLTAMIRELSNQQRTNQRSLMNANAGQLFDQGAMEDTEGLLDQSDEGAYPEEGSLESGELFDRTPGAALAAAQAGVPAAPSSPGRGITQAVSRGGLTRQAFNEAAPFFNQALDKVVEYFADNLIPMVRWVQKLGVPSEMRNAILGAMYTAPNVRDDITRRAMEDHGGSDLNRAIGDLHTKLKAKKPKATVEDVIRDAGYWMTARYALIKNQRMLESDQAAVDEAELQLLTAQQDPNTTRAELVLLQDAVDEAQAVYDAREYALNGAQNVDNHVGRDGRPVGLAAGMNNAQAAAFMRVAEQQFGRADLESTAKHLYRINAFRMATDIESGRIAPQQAALYSPEIAAIEPDLIALRDAARDPNTSQQKLETLRQKVVDALARTSLYVPTTGDPSKGFEGDVLGSGFRAPNVAKDRRLAGRTGSLSDDGISASLGGMQRSAAAAGWGKFTSLIAQAYNKMTPDQRDAADIRQVDITALDRLSDNIIIHGDKGYSIKDGAELQAMRKENVDARSKFMTILETPTRLFAYAATQLNPLFGAVNMGRDIWERSENLRTKTLFTPSGRPVDAKKAAQRMIQLGANGSVFKDLVNYLWRGDKNGKYAVLLREFEQFGGGGSKYAESIRNQRRDLVNDIENVRSKPRAALKAIGDVVGKWNEVFDSVSALSAYAALREQGMSKEDAAAASLDLMNFRKSGSAMPIVRAMYAFAQPAVTGGTNLVNMLKTRVGRKRLAGYMVAFAVLTQILGALGGEDEDLGKDKMDLLDDYTKDRFLPIPVPGGGVAKLPLGFGLPVLANVFARQAMGFAKGDSTLGEAISESVSRGVTPAFTPLEDSKIKLSEDPLRWFAQTFAPTVTKPAVNVAINRSGLGGEVVKEAFLDKNKFKSEQGAPLTAAEYKEIAQTVRGTFGIDMAPEQVREIIRGYSLGLFRTAVQSYIENPNRELQGKETENPILKSFYLADPTANALIGEMNKFESEGLQVLREKNANPDFEPQGREAEVLDLFEQWQAADKAFRTRGSALTKAGVGKGVDPERLSLREERTGVQQELIRQYNALKR